MEKFKPYAICFLGGILYSLAWPTSLGKGVMFTTVPGMAMLLWALFREERIKHKLLLALAFCLPYTLIGFYWIPDTLAEFGQLPYIVALLLGALFTLISAPQLYLFVLFTHSGIQDPKGKAILSRYPGIAALIIAGVFTFIEYFTPQQFSVMIGQPWARIGEHLGYASIGGLPLYGFFSFLAAVELANFANFKNIERKRSFSKINAMAIALFILSNPFIKPSSLKKENADALPKLNLRLVQANISNFLKVDSESGGYASVSQVIRRYRELSEKNSEIGKLDLIIWPETAYPFGVETSKEDLSKSSLPTVFQDIPLRQNSDFFVGGYDVKEADGDFYQNEYNTNFHVGANGKLKDVYHKHILIPFGETLPFGFLNRYLSKYINNISFFSEGSSYPLFKTQSGHKFINTICYEILKPEFVRDYLNRLEEENKQPHALINLTNDSWYGDTSEPEQHLFLASWRALEFNLPIIRSTNTGISTVLNASGQEIKRLGVGITGNLDLSVQLEEREATLFQRFGFWTLVPFWFALFIFHCLLLKFKR